MSLMNHQWICSKRQYCQQDFCIVFELDYTHILADCYLYFDMFFRNFVMLLLRTKRLVCNSALSVLNYKHMVVTENAVYLYKSIKCKKCLKYTYYHEEQTDLGYLQLLLRFVQSLLTLLTFSACVCIC